MSKPYSVDFPWLRFLWSTLFWALVVMMILRFALLLFSKDVLGTFEHDRQLFPLLLRLIGIDILTFLFQDILMALVVLVPCFYVGMGACVYLEKRGGDRENQFKTTFRAASSLLFLAIILIYGFTHLVPLKLADQRDVALTVRLILIYYIFDANVVDRIWPDIFEKR